MDWPFHIFNFFNYANKPNPKERIVDLTVDQMSETSVPFLPYSELHERHYITALKMFLDKPLVGIGTNLFRIKCKDKNTL